MLNLLQWRLLRLLLLLLKELRLIKWNAQAFTFVTLKLNEHLLFGIHELLLLLLPLRKRYLFFFFFVFSFGGCECFVVYDSVFFGLASIDFLLLSSPYPSSLDLFFGYGDSFFF